MDTDSSNFELIEDEASEADRKGAVQDTSGDSKVVRFSVAKKSCLNAFFQNGMNGVGKKHASLIAQAARDTCLSTDQVKVNSIYMHIPLFHYIMLEFDYPQRWIKKKSYRRKHAKRPLNTGMFQKAASNAYTMMEEGERERLIDMATNKDEEVRHMTVKEIKRVGTKAFRRIQNEVCLIVLL